MDKKTFGRMLKRYRMKAKMSQSEMAQKCGQSRQYIQLVESGLSPSIWKADQILRSLGVSLTVGDSDSDVSLSRRDA